MPAHLSGASLISPSTKLNPAMCGIDLQRGVGSVTSLTANDNHAKLDVMD
jgi:hypothetical protein